MKKSFGNIFFLLIILLILFGILKDPQISLISAKKGLSIWFNIVIPSLLPFFIISEILINIGFINIIGNFLEPLMRPIFNLPGIAAFPFSMSIISGYPTGTKIVSDLRKNSIITKIEGERMVSFSSTSGPLFMLGAVSVGMLKNPSLAPLIIYPHYLGAITIGLLFRFYKYNDTNNKINTNKNIKFKQLLKTSHFKKTFSIGTILANSVKNSMNSLLLIGGFIIFYSVLIELVLNSKLLNLLYYVIPIKINLKVLQGIFTGIIEITNGCQKLSDINMNLITKITIINFLIGWGGISIHSQALSFLSNTDINSKIYIFGKFFHGIFSSIYGLLLYKLKYKSIIETTFLPNINTIDSIYFMNWPVIFTNSIKLALFMILYLFISSLIIFLILCFLSTD